MAEFWQLISIFVCLTGFLIAGGLLLIRGEPLSGAIARGVVVAVVLYVIQRVLGGILVAVTDSDSAVTVKPTADGEDPKALRN